MLELRPNCELCDCDLPPESDQARICSYECTFCATCVDEVLMNVCPNCGGNFVPRPIRPSQSRRSGPGLNVHPAGTKRRASKRTSDERASLTTQLRDVAPNKR